ncbi:hypothetical protein OSB04_026757 [Centaurea solstitialis]|uniref:Uncharacterized protein n=1 Tax=Centaurea solstitialis TaxID=347529 RepID=A0AA38SPJ6_9ASTR|nr:hypothetical protein OSB04_026757 [Centaurea solstitialis]
MSRHSSSGGGGRQTVEAAPPRLIRIDRRPTMEKKLPTIKEDECSSGCGDQGGQLQSFHGNRTLSASSAKTLYKRLYNFDAVVTILSINEHLSRSSKYNFSNA